MSSLTIDTINSRWNEVLDAVLDRDRIAWLAFFDARVISVDSEKLVISFADAQKFSGDHNFSMARNPRHIALLQETIEKVFKESLRVQEV
jgi:hypothetical protein